MAGNSVRGRTQRALALPILCLIFLLQSRDGCSQGLKLSVSLGFAGYTVPDRWAPLRIHAEGAPASSSGNQGASAPPLRLEILRKHENDTSPLIERFSLHETDRVECPVFVDEFSETLIVRIIADTQVVTEKTISTRARTFPGHLVLACDIPSKVLSAMGGSLLPLEPVQVAAVASGDLPSTGIGYDSVSAIVISDPGPVLSPSQIEAARSWVSGGGVLVVFGDRSGRESIAASLSARFGERDSESGEGGRDVLRIGLGRIERIRGGVSEQIGVEEDRYWKDLFGFKPYESSFRLTPAQCFPRSFMTPRKASSTFKANNGLTIGLFAWAVVVVLLLSLKKRKAIFLVSFTILASCGALLGGSFLDRLWKRGVVAETKAVILPYGNSLYADLRLSLPASAANSMDSLASTPWDFTASLGNSEKGIFRPGFDEPPAWEHGSPRPALAIRSATKSSIECLAQIPNEASALSVLSAISKSEGNPGAGLPSAALGRAEKLAFASLAGGKAVWMHWDKFQTAWLSSEYGSGFIGEDAEWLNALLASGDGLSWYIGLESLSGLVFKVQGGDAGKVLWAYPTSIREPAEAIR